ncbi:MAG: endonuclease domain-containing protein [Azoarcus sp.]|nr:endonuclease domain-containing protein [Azoarcus sp.]
MPIKYLRTLIPHARKLRREMTPQEKRLWYEFLANFSPRFQRQKPIDRFIADFYCYKAKLIVEIDGSQHFTESGLAYDAEREAILNSLGLRVIRFSNRDVNENFESVCNAILQFVQHSPLRPQHPGDADRARFRHFAVGDDPQRGDGAAQESR